MLLALLLAQVGKAVGKTKGPQPATEGFWHYADLINDTLKNPNFDAAIQNPWFWGGSVVAMTLALFRGWKIVLIGYPLAIVMWGVVDRYILKDTTSGAGSSNIVVFAGLTVGVAGLGIYFLLIRD